MNKSVKRNFLVLSLKAFRFALKDERGQVLPIVALVMVGFLGMCGFVVDVGRVYVSYRELQASTDAAALAGAETLPSSSATTVATAYSSTSGNKNAFSGSDSTQITTTLKCISSLSNSGIACVSPTNANAIQVRQTLTVPMYFTRLLGTSSVTMSATATASMRGGSATPYNIAIIADTTASMSTSDSGDCNSTRLTCELQGIRTLLSELWPCASTETSCGTATGGTVANPVDNVSLFTFPNMTTATTQQSYDCSSTNPKIYAYTFPSPAATSLTTMPYTSGGNTVQMTYQVLNYSSDYKTSDTTSSLNTVSNLVRAAGGKAGCTGMGNPGGEGTYYAGALYAAQASLLAEQRANPGSQNVIILLSDGDASATQTQMVTGTQSTTLATNNGLYPSWVNECQQAVTAAQAIALTGTKVYSVAYGAAATSGCATDTGTYKNKPCNAMKDIASSPAYFFSDYTASQNAGQCVSASQPTTSLNQIFTQIAGSFMAPRLIPDGTT